MNAKFLATLFLITSTSFAQDFLATPSSLVTTKKEIALTSSRNLPIYPEVDRTKDMPVIAVLGSADEGEEMLWDAKILPTMRNGDVKIEFQGLRNHKGQTIVKKVDTADLFIGNSCGESVCSGDTVLLPGGKSGKVVGFRAKDKQAIVQVLGVNTAGDLSLYKRFLEVELTFIK